jgi:hypothetical protein
VSLLDVLSEDRSTQTIDSVVGTLNDLIQVLEGQDAHDRAEDFLIKKNG